METDKDLDQILDDIEKLLEEILDQTACRLDKVKLARKRWGRIVSYVRIYIIR